MTQAETLQADMTQVETRFEVFGARIHAACGSEIAAVGLCGRGMATLYESKLSELRFLRFDGADDYEADRLLADALCGLFPSGVYAVGATVRILNYAGSMATGGVLGDPQRGPSSSEAELEPLCDGLWLYTRPGGPGFAACADEHTASAIARRLSAHADTRVRAEEAIRLFARFHVCRYLLIADGTAGTSGGIAVAEWREGGYARSIRFEV